MECSPRDVVAKVLNSDIVESEFKLPSLYCFHILTYTPEKQMNPTYAQDMSEIFSVQFFNKDVGWYAIYKKKNPTQTRPYSYILSIIPIKY